MPRLPRRNSRCKFFHIMVQGFEKRFIFDGPVNMNTYLDLIVKNSRKIGVSILSYCIMSNHAHMILYVKDIECMTKFFRCVNTAFARYFNLKNQRVGFVFRDRYKSQQIFTTKQLFNTINYIHNNPVKANICGYPDEYEFSSYNEYFMDDCEIINREILTRYFKSNEIFRFHESN